MGLKESFVSESTSGFDYGTFSPKRLREVVDLHPWWQSLRVSLERLRERHLLRDGSYSHLRAFLPVPVLAFVWLQATHLQLHALLSSSISFRHLVLAAGTISLWNTSLLLQPRRPRSLRRDITAEIWLLVRTSLACGLVLLLGNGFRSTWIRGVELGSLLSFAFLSSSLLLLFGAFCVSTQLLPDPSRSRKALIIGSGPRASYLRSLIRNSHTRLEIIGCIDEEYVGLDCKSDNYLGGIGILPNLLKSEPIELVLIGLPIKSHYQEIQDVIATCETVGVESHYMSDIFATTRTTHRATPSASRFTVVGDPPRDVRHWIKRGLDLLIAVPLFVLLQPVFLVIAIAIKLSDGGPIFFIQQRYGQHRQQFHMFKFRTMVIDAERRQAALEDKNEAQGPVFKLKADPRVTKIGAFLRRTSLDELPQLINVLRGEMSLVGPRPLPLRDVSRFETPWLLRRFSAPPGLTCLWQVRGRSNTTFDEWIKLDLEYIDNWSLGLDFLILAATIPAVLRGSGAM